MDPFFYKLWLGFSHWYIIDEGGFRWSLIQERSLPYYDDNFTSWRSKLGNLAVTI